MQNHFKGFYQYCKGLKLKDIAASQGVSIDLVKTWMNRYHWVDKRKACTDPDGNVDLEKAKGFMFGKGNLDPVCNLDYNPDMYSQKDINTRIKENTSPVNNELKEYISSVLTHSVRYYSISRASTDEEVDCRIQDYFVTCINDGMIPTIEGLWLCLGIQKDCFNDWANGKRGTVRAECIKKAKLCVQQCTTQLALGGKIDKILFIFISKNHYGYSDKQEVEITHNDALGVGKTKEELLKDLNDTPQEDCIDVDFSDLMTPDSDDLST